MVTFTTALGVCGVRWSDAGLTEVVMPRARGLNEADPCARADLPAWVAGAVAGITALLAGERRDLREVALDHDALDPFRRRLFAALREIGPGEITTYGELAREVGAPGAAQAVGRALGSNDWPIVVPCHRVLAADGSLHGFSAPGGIVTKRRMLEIERAPGFVQQALFA
jgi:methylated-DNA-[protein]-cysteine S-methyltransferase